MAARTGMSTLISTIRGFCNLGTSDYTLGTATHWSDDHIQTVLDRYRTTVIHEKMLAVSAYESSGSIAYKDFYSGWGNWEETTGGTSIFIVENYTGDDIATANYSVDYALGIVTFTADQQGSTRYVTGRSYDLYGAAADIWRMKGGAYAVAVDFKTDNMSVKRSDVAKHCREMFNYYSMMSNPRQVDLARDDNP